VSDETVPRETPKVGKPKKPNFYRDKADRLQAENDKLKTELAVKDHFETIDEFKDEHDRATEKHKEDIAEATERGVDPDEIIERGLDSSEVRTQGEKGREWAKNYQLRWVNRTSRDGSRMSFHEGLGYFFVKPSKHPVKPSHGIKREDQWLYGETVLMACPRELYERRRRAAYEKMLHQGGKARESTREEINKLIRDDTGQPHASPGITKSYRDNTWDSLTEEAPITGPSAHTISPA
jgi:hypothetical protein